MTTAKLARWVEAINTKGQIVISGSALALLVYIGAEMNTWRDEMNRQMTEIRTSFLAHIKETEPKVREHDVLMRDVHTLLSKFEDIPKRVHALEIKYATLESRILNWMESADNRLARIERALERNP